MSIITSRSFFKDTSITFFQRIVSQLSQICFVLIVASTLGAKGNGQVAISIMLPTVLARLLTFGAPISNTYFISNREIQIQALCAYNLLIWIFASIFGSSISFCLLYYFNEQIFPGVARYFLLTAVVFFPLILSYDLLCSFYRGLQNFKIYNVTMFILTFSRLVFVVILVLTLDFGVKDAILSWGIGYIAGIIFALYNLRKYMALKFSRHFFSRGEFMDWICYGLKSYVGGVSSFINLRVDIFLVNLFLGPTGTGIYAIAVQIAERLFTLSTAVRVVLMPKIAEEKEKDVWRKTFTPMVARWVGIFSILFAVFLYFAADILIRLVLGVEFLDASPILIYLLPGVVFLSVARVLGSDIAARGRPELNSIREVIMIALNVFANLILIPKLGLIGAALATTIVYVASSVICNIQYNKLSNNKWCVLFVITQKEFGILFGKIFRWRV